MFETEQLHRAIVNLPEVQRRRVVQYYFEGLTYQQIAREEHCSFQAVAKSISAAEKRMKKFLKQVVEKRLISEETGEKGKLYGGNLNQEANDKN